jgi:hypothetical protein
MRWEEQIEKESGLNSQLHTSKLDYKLQCVILDF